VNDDAGCLGPLVFGHGETVLQHMKTYAKERFEREKRAVLGSLPDPYKQQWGKLHDHEARSVLVKGPYDVPMGTERSM
jgi:hypothetical protein